MVFHDVSLIQYFKDVNVCYVPTMGESTPLKIPRKILGEKASPHCKRTFTAHIKPFWKFSKISLLSKGWPQYVSFAQTYSSFTNNRVGNTSCRTLKAKENDDRIFERIYSYESFPKRDGVCHLLIYKLIESNYKHMYNLIEREPGRY